MLKPRQIIQWTTELDQRVAELWKTKNAHDIAIDIGYPGYRSAIIGRLHRLGIKCSRARDSHPSYRRRNGPGDTRSPGNGPLLRKRKPKRNGAGLNMPIESKNTPFLETRYGQCRWIVQESRDIHAVRCCGIKTAYPGSPWCSHHWGIAITVSRGPTRQATLPEARQGGRRRLVPPHEILAGQKGKTRTRRSRPPLQSKE